MKRWTGPEPEATEEDLRLARAIGAAFEPESMDARRRLAFRRGIDERIASRQRSARTATLGLVASAAVATLLWIVVPRSTTPPPVVDSSATASLASVLSTIEDADDAGAPEDYLPDDYVVLASYFDVSP